MKVSVLSIAAALVSSVHGQSTRGTSSPTSDTLAKTKSAKISKGSKVAGATDPDFLAVQMAESCVLGEDEYGGYYLESSKWRRATNVFSDRGGQFRVMIPMDTKLVNLLVRQAVDRWETRQLLRTSLVERIVRLSITVLCL